MKLNPSFSEITVLFALLDALDLQLKEKIMVAYLPLDIINIPSYVGNLL